MNEKKVKNEENKSGKVILIITIPLLIFLIIASYSGIFISETYARNTPSFGAQGIGQDIVNLFIVGPLLLLSAIYFYRDNNKAKLLWAGLVSYILYSYVIYGFAQPFNFLFLVYCAVLGLSFYSLQYFILTMSKKSVKNWYGEKAPFKVIQGFFIIIAALFYFVWLSEVIPALLNNEIPESIIENGVNTNPVHVLDLSIILPMLILTAILLFKDNNFGYLLAPILLIFLTTMALAVVGMVFTMILNEIETDVSLSIIFLVIAIICIVLTLLLLKSVKEKK